MTTMNISLPDALRDFIDERVSLAGYGSSSEYVRELVRRDQERLQLRAMILEGAASAVTGPVDARYFAGLRKRIAGAAAEPLRPGRARGGPRSSR